MTVLQRFGSFGRKPGMAMGLFFLMTSAIQGQPSGIAAARNKLQGNDSIAYLRIQQQLANGDKSGRWPASAPLPLQGALLPFHRIVAYYGNLFSSQMGILGELPRDKMLKHLQNTCASWQAADTMLKVLPALHYIAVTAQASPGRDKKYRLRMPAAEIKKVISWSREIKGITFLDIQTGHSTIKDELPPLEAFLKMPDVHLGIDPEYAMSSGAVPCTQIGSLDATDINDAIEFLQKLVQTYRLPPKVLVVHRFTQQMVTRYAAIKKVPEVQVVLNMDGFGSVSLKQTSYRSFIFREPVQFAGCKLFYKIDKPRLFTLQEVLRLKPIPVYIQYQ